MCAMIGLDLPATCRLVADFSRTRFEYLDEHLLALIARHMRYQEAVWMWAGALAQTAQSFRLQ
jgi:hypothetical protein